jgi:hypothetical protein
MRVGRRLRRRSATPLLGIVSFLLTPQDERRRIRATFSEISRSRGPERFACAAARVENGRRAETLTAIGKITRNSRGRIECSICRDGPCSASIRSARPVATGCGRLTPEGTSAATAARRFATFRPRSARACECARVRWAAIVRRAVRPGGQGNPTSARMGDPARRSSGLLVPVHAGTSRPRLFFP